MYMAYCALPDAFARYIATSAARKEVVGDRPERDSHARADEHLAPLDLERLLQGRDDPLRGVDGRCRSGNLLDEDGELVTAEPRDRVAGRERVAEPHTDTAQERVPRPMAERVVDALEVVEVEEEDGDLGTCELAAKDECMLDAVREERAVRESGQSVVEGLVTKLLLGFVAGGDVEQVALEHRTTRIGDDACLVLDPHVPAVERAQAVLDEQRLAGHVRALVRREHALPILGMQDLDEQVVVLDPLSNGVAEHLLDLRARVDVRADVVQSIDVHGQRQLLDERPKAGGRSSVEGGVAALGRFPLIRHRAYKSSSARRSETPRSEYVVRGGLGSLHG